MSRYIIFAVVFLSTISSVFTPKLSADSFAPFPATTTVSSGIVPENFRVRLEMHELITAPKTEALSAKSKVFTQKTDGHRVLFQVKRQKGAFYLLFTNEKAYKFPLYSAGSYIIKRDLEHGKFIQAKIFTRDDPGCFARVFPHGDRTMMNVYLYHYPVYKDIVVAMNFREILNSPFARIVNITEESIDWSLFETHPLRDGSVVSSPVVTMVGKIRKALPFLKDQDDGAMNKEGDFVFINNLTVQDTEGFNCSGFVKWVADGIANYYTGSYLSVDELKIKHPASRGNRWSKRYEDGRDPYFGLDWTRNIAVTIGELRGGFGYSDPESADVRKVPFFEYVEDVGYPVEHLKVILYLLAVENPGRFYLGSVNSEFGDGPVLRQHHHVVSLFPYFEPDGTFRVAVFERNVESGLDSLINRYQGDFIHLVGIDAPPEYTPAMQPLKHTQRSFFQNTSVR